MTSFLFILTVGTKSEFLGGKKHALRSIFCGSPGTGHSSYQTEDMLQMPSRGRKQREDQSCHTRQNGDTENDVG